MRRLHFHVGLHNPEVCVCVCVRDVSDARDRTYLYLYQIHVLEDVVQHMTTRSKFATQKPRSYTHSQLFPHNMLY